MTVSEYERRTSTPLTILAVLFLGVYGAPIVWTDLPTAGNELHHFGWDAWFKAQSYINPFSTGPI